MATQGIRRSSGALPSELESARAKLVYLYLQITDGTTVSELQEALEIPQVTLYPTLRTLCERGLVEDADGEFRPADGE